MNSIDAVVWRQNGIGRCEVCYKRSRDNFRLIHLVVDTDDQSSNLWLCPVCARAAAAKLTRAAASAERSTL